MIKGVLFDFWGTIVANGIYSPTKQALNILRINLDFKDFIVRFEKTFMTQHFETQAQGFKKVCEEFKVKPYPIIIDKLIGMWNKNKLTAKPYPETIKVLKKLREKGIKIGLVTNTDNFSVKFVMDKYDLRKYFDVIAMSCEIGALKTNPKLFEYALEKLGLNKDEVIMVGDSMESDIKGAKKAEIKPILIDRKGRREYPDKIMSLNEIEKYLR